MLERIVIRLSTRYLLGFIGLLDGLFAQDLVKGLVFIAFVQGNIAWLESPATDPESRYGGMADPPPHDLARPLRPHKIALSMGLSRETVRRKAAALVEAGDLQDVGRGLVASVAVASRRDVNQAMLANTRLVADLYRNLAEAGFIEPLPPPSGAETPHRSIMRVSIGYILRAMDDIRQMFDGDILTGIIFSAIVDANTAYLNEEPGRPYANLKDFVPDELRRPISALALAGRIGLPRETVRRHIRKLEAAGYCHSLKCGVIAPQAVLAKPEIVAATVRNAANVRLLCNQLRNLGFVPRCRREDERAPVGADHRGRAAQALLG